MAFMDRMRWFNPPTPPPLTEDATGRLTRRDLDEEEKDQLRRLLQQFQISQDEAQQMNAGPHQMGFSLPNRGSSQRGQGQDPLDPFRKEYAQKQAEVAGLVSQEVALDEPDSLNRRRLLTESLMGGFGRTPEDPLFIQHYNRGLAIADAQTNALRLKSGITGGEEQVYAGQPHIEKKRLEPDTPSEFIDILKEGGGESIDPFALSVDQQEALKKAMKFLEQQTALKRGGF